MSLILELLTEVGLCSIFSRHYLNTACLVKLQLQLTPQRKPLSTNAKRKLTINLERCQFQLLAFHTGIVFIVLTVILTSVSNAKIEMKNRSDY